MQRWQGGRGISSVMYLIGGACAILLGAFVGGWIYLAGEFAWERLFDGDAPSEEAIWLNEPESAQQLTEMVAAMESLRSGPPAG